MNDELKQGKGNFIPNLPEHEVIDGRNTVTGKFVNKAGPGRPKGSRNKMTQRFLDRVNERTEVGNSMEDILMDIAQDPECHPELRFKAAAKILDLVVPKASSVEVIMDDKEKMTKEQIDAKLADLLATALVNPHLGDESENE